MPARGAGRPAATPVRGGAERDPRHPRVTVLARGGRRAAAGVGWAALCRLVTQTHLRGERGAPVSPRPRIAAALRGGRAGGGRPSPLLVLLGPDSDVGRALLARRPDRARALLRRLAAPAAAGALVIEVVCHGGPEGTPASRSHARRLLGLADEAGLPAVLTAAVRHVDPGERAVVDVLDAARRLVALDTRHLDRVTDAAHLATHRHDARHRPRGHRWRPRPGRRPGRARPWPWLGCAQNPRRDLGIGSVHLPEPAVLGIEPGMRAQEVLGSAAVGRSPRATPGRASAS